MGTLRTGIKDGLCVQMIRRSEFFQEDWYRRRAGLAEKEDAAAHYYHQGWKTEDPSPRFPQELYYEVNPDVKEAGVCPLAHYLLYGKKQQRIRRPGMVLNQYHAWPVTRGFLRSFFEMTQAVRIHRSRSARILVIAHVFYIEAIPEMVQYMKNLRPYPWDLVVTTVEGPDAEETERRIRKAFPAAQVRIFPNRGFDIAPFWQIAGETDLSRYDIVFKIQSKRHFSKEGCSAAGMYICGRDWFDYLFRATLGARWIHRNVELLMRGDGPELIAAQLLLQQDPPFKERIIRKTLEDRGISLEKGYQFVAGSCFAIRAEKLGAIRNAPVALEDFEPAERAKFTLAHAMERYISGAVAPGKQWGNPVCGRRQRKNLQKGAPTLKAYWYRVELGEKYHLPDEFIMNYLEGHPVHERRFLAVDATGLAWQEKDGKVFLKDGWEKSASPGKWNGSGELLVVDERGEVVLGSRLLTAPAESGKRIVGVLCLEDDADEA